MIFLQLSDFIGGKYDIPDAATKSPNKADVQSVIDAALAAAKLHGYILTKEPKDELDCSLG